MAIIDVILAGERDPERLAELKDRRIKADKQTIVKSLKGDYRPEHLFTLKQMLQFYRNYRQMIDACDEEIERHLQEIDARNDSDDSPHPPTKRYQLQGTGSDSNFDLKTHLCRLLGTDLTQIDGISDLTTHIFFTEVGPDLSLFKTASHFCSWLGLCRTNNLLFMLKNHL